MSGGSKSRTNSTTYSTNNTVSAQLSDEAQLAQNGATARDLGTALNVAGSGNSISVTDNGAVALALQTAERATQRATESAAASQGRVLNTTRDILNDQVGEIRNLAESLKVGDENTAKLISMAIVIGLVLVAIFFIWKG